jgi:hypothetical protein
VGIAVASREEEKRPILRTLSQLDERAYYIVSVALRNRRHKTPVLVAQKYPLWGKKTGSELTS